MAIPPPDAARLAALNEHYAFGLSEAELAEFNVDATTLLSRPRRVRRSQSKDDATSSNQNSKT